MLNRRLVGSLTITAVLSLVACNANQETSLLVDEVAPVEENQSQIDSVPADIEEDERPFELYYHQLIMSLASHDPSSFNGLIHPDKGCYLIESPGAIPMITLITNIEQVKQYGTDRSVLNLTDKFISFALQHERLPTIDCDSPEGFYSKEGTFSADTNAFAGDQIWKYLGLEDSVQASIAELAGTIDKTIINTAGFKAYFSKIDGVWYLTFFDIRVPCTA